MALPSPRGAMCDLPEEELEEYLQWLELAHSRVESKSRTRPAPAATPLTTGPDQSEPTPAFA